MKILYLVHGSDMMGANRCLLDLITGLQQYAVENVVLLPENGELAKVLTERGVEYIIAPYHNWAFTKYISKGYWLNFKLQHENQSFLKAIVEKVKDRNFDIIYSNSSVIGMGAQLAEALHKPHVWHIREFGEKDYNKAFYKGRNYFNLWANKATAIISMSAAIDKEVLPKVTAPKYVIHDGIISKDAIAKIVPNQNHNKETFTFLIIGLIHPTKGQFTALQAFHKVYQKNQNVRLLIAGSGRKLYTQKIKNYIKNNKLEHAAQYLGYVTNPYQIHQQADCVLMCSRSEGMGRVTIEGMVFGNPVIGFNGGATPELIDHQVDGLIYSGGIAELAGCMEYLAANRNIAAQFGKAGRKKAEDKYTIEGYIGEVYEILGKV